MAEGDDVIDLTEMDGEDEGMDILEFLASSLQSSEGESIADVLSTLTKHVENQNKILIKIASLLVKKE
jgi:hypothetical protein